MKRLLLICILAVCALPLPAQEEEGLFTLERTFELPGVSAQEVQKRAKRWFDYRNEVSSTKHKFDDNMYLYPYSQWGIFSYIGVNITSRGKTYSCYPFLYIDIIFDDEAYTVKLRKVTTTAYKKVGLFRDFLDNFYGLKEDDSHEYDKFLRKKKMYQLSQDIKAFAAAEFEKMLLEIEAVMKQPSAVPLEAFSLYEKLW